MAMMVVAADLLAVVDGWGDMSGELPALLVTLKADTKLCAIGCYTAHSIVVQSTCRITGVAHHCQPCQRLMQAKHNLYVCLPSFRVQSSAA